jgi:hypothetical protein
MLAKESRVLRDKTGGCGMVVSETVRIHPLSFKFDDVAGRAHPDQRRQYNFSSYVDLSTKIIQQMRYQRRRLLTRQMRGTRHRNQRKHNPSSHLAADDRSFLHETFSAIILGSMQVPYQHDNTGFGPAYDPTTSQATTHPRGWQASGYARMRLAGGRVVGRVRRE